MPHSFTPGPWETLKFSQHELQTDFAMVKIGERVHMIGYSDEDKANAQLIASAPDLLGAVQYAADVFAEYVALYKAKWAAGAEKAQSNQRHLQVMLEAIAKAGGNIPPDCCRQRDELAEENVSQGQVYWEVLNGVCSYGFYGTKDEAEKVCFDMQKSHDLSGSLAAFNVRPRYTKAGGEV